MTKISLVYNFESEEELRAHLAVETRVAAPTQPVAVEVKAAAPVAVETDAEPDEAPDTEVSRDSVDDDGMPYNADFHSDPPTMTAKGLWRAKRGKTAEADAARAAFKAGGGNVEAPVITTVPAMTLPGMTTDLPAPAPAPVSITKLAEKIGGMMRRGVIDAPTVSGMYTSVTKASDAAAAMQVFNTNETARAALYSQLLVLEPEL